ncbi:hypothetical protein JCM10450v2_002270 [Rhodotorula kratochvilovae]
MPAGRASTQGTPLRNRTKRKAVPLSPSRSSVGPRDVTAARQCEDWSTDDDSGGTEELLIERETAAHGPSSGRKASKRAVQRARTSAAYSIFAPFRQVVRLCVKVTFALLPYLLPLVPYFLLAASLYLGIALARSYLEHYLSYFPALLQGPLSHLADLSLPLPRLPSDLSLATLPLLPCTTLGIFCGSKSSPSFELLSAGAARAAVTRAHHALDIFESVLDLGSGESAGMSLDPVAIWELATAVRYTSLLEDRAFLSERLSDLGDKSREVKDHVIALNAQGFNSFHWVVHEFTRLEELITAASSPSAPRMTTRQRAEFERLLSSLFDKISSSLGDLLTALDRAIPSATQASDAAHHIFRALRSEESVKTEELDSVDWFQRMIAAVDAGPQGGKKVKMLRRDLEITRASAGAVMDVWQSLEDTRNSLKLYQQHVGQYKAGVVGFHLSGHGLSVEQEVTSLKVVMDEMRGALDAARQRSGGAGGRRRRAQELPEA